MHWSRLFLLLFLLPHIAGAITQEEFDRLLSSPPPSQVLDQAQMLNPVELAEVSSHLMQATRKNVHVYLLTIPSLPPSPDPIRAIQDRLEQLADKLAADWVADSVGGVVVYDDGSGLISVASSKATDARHPGMELLLDLRLREILGPGATRRSPGQVAIAVVDVIARQEAKRARERIVIWIVGGILAVFALAVAVITLLGQRMRRGDATAQIPNEQQPVETPAPPQGTRQRRSRESDF